MTDKTRFADPIMAEGYAVIPAAVLRRPDLQPGPKVLYSLILAYAWQNRQAWPGQKTLAAQAGVTARTVRTWLKELQTAGLITATKRGQGQTNLYTVEALTAAPKEEKASDRKHTSGLERKHTSGLERKHTSGLERKHTSGKEYKEKSIREEREEGPRAPTEKKETDTKKASENVEALGTLIDHFNDTYREKHNAPYREAAQDSKRAARILLTYGREKAGELVSYFLNGYRDEWIEDRGAWNWQQLERMANAVNAQAGQEAEKKKALRDTSYRPPWETDEDAGELEQDPEKALEAIKKNFGRIR